MPIPLPDLEHAALLSMDLHTSVVAAYLQGPEDFLTRIAGVQAAARESGIPVIHVQVGFRPGLPEISSRNALFAALKSSPQWQKMFAGDSGALHPAVAPMGDEIVVTKHRVSAFAGTDLEMILRAQEIDTLVLLGVATSGVVLSTLLDAADADFRLAVVPDCCADRDPELDACLKQRFFPMRAAVADAAEIADAMRRRSS
ncbi:MAG TPA: isochorismatase family cysteine hydrolase [Terracidiphilus sp.]|jgi:nicotinamidase-related amidase|nr:isochorismatase family cysteine hydrolase [Terracidiphilus sp.]